MNKKTNYKKLFLIIIPVVFITIITCNLYKNYEGNKINSSYISKYVSTIKYDELKSAILEFSSNTFVYISYTGDKNIYNLEKDLYKVVEKNELTDKFLYVDATKIKENANYIKEINNMICPDSTNIKNLPAIIYFKDNTPVDVVTSSSTFFGASNFSQLLEKYEITGEKND